MGLFFMHKQVYCMKNKLIPIIFQKMLLESPLKPRFVMNFSWEGEEPVPLHSVISIRLPEPSRTTFIADFTVEQFGFPQRRHRQLVESIQ